MNKSKKIEVNASSLLGLKAELFRKQEEYKRQKTQNHTKPTPKASTKKPNVWTKQNSGIHERAKRDFQPREEEEDALLKSRKALEAKTKIYEQMTQSLPADDETSELYLVDFQRKVINSIKDKRMKDDEIPQEVSDPEQDPPHPDEEWVDYVDSLGRSRRCLRKDVDYFTRIDQSLTQRDSRKEEPKPEADRWNKGNDLLSDDMRKEIERREWEEEEEDEIQNSEPVGPIHYQNVQQREVRNHGVGYYAFSVEEIERKKQFDMLENLRKQTETNKSNRMKLKEKRKAMLQARLAKVQERKSIVLPSDDDSSQSEDDDETEANKLDEAAPTPTLVAEDAPKAVRPWDRGKVGVRNEGFQKPPATKKMMTEGDWMNTQRRERNPDFAPPQFYFNSKKKSDPPQDELLNIPLPDDE